MISNFQNSKIFQLISGKISEDTLPDVTELLHSENLKLRGKYHETYLHLLLLPRAKEQRMNQHTLATINGLLYRMVDAGMDVNWQDMDKNTPLHIAAYNDVHPSIVATLIRLGADPAIQNWEGGMAIDYAEVNTLKKLLNFIELGIGDAMMKRNIRLVQALLDFWIKTDITIDGQSLEDIASNINNEEIKLLLIEADSRNKFVHAILSDNAEKAQNLLDTKLSETNPKTMANPIDKKKQKISLLFEAIKLRCHKTAKILLAEGADVNEIINAKKETLFSYVITRSYHIDMDFIEILMSKANFELLNVSHFDIVIGAWRKKYSEKAMQYLLDNGVSLAGRDGDGYTVRDRILQTCCYLSHSQLKQHLFFIDQFLLSFVTKGQVDKLMALADEGYLYLDVTDIKGKSLHQHAVDSKQEECAKFLENFENYQKSGLEAHRAIVEGNLLDFKNLVDSKKVAFKSRNGLSFLHSSILYQRLHFVLWLLEKFPEMVNYKDGMGRTPLHFACAVAGNPRIKEMLLNAGAAEDIADSNGKTPKDYASDNKLKAMVMKLKEETQLRFVQLLYHYANILDGVLNKNMEQVKNALKSVDKDTLRSIDGMVPQKFPKYNYVPLLFATIELGEQKIALELMNAGANVDIIHKITKGNGKMQSMGLCEFAEFHLAKEVLKELKGEEYVKQLEEEKASNGMIMASCSTPDSLKEECILPGEELDEVVIDKNKDDEGEDDTSSYAESEKKSGTCLIM